MNGKKYVIRWKSKVNGRIGQGSRHFDHHEGQELIAELNADFPDIEHELVEAHAKTAVTAASTEAREHALSE